MVQSKEEIVQFETEMQSALGNSVRLPIAAKLGYKDSNGVIYLPVPDERTDQPDRYYFHQASGTEFQGEAFLKAGTLENWMIRYGTPIRLERDKLTDEWEIVGIDTRYAAQFFQSVTQDDNVFYTYNKLAPGLLTQSTPVSMRARVLAGAYTSGTLWRYHRTQETVDWSLSPDNANVPTTNLRARFVLVQINFDTGNLAYKYGNEVDLAVSFTQAYQLNDINILPVIDDGYVRCGYIKLVANMTQITNANIIPLQDYLSLGGGAEPDYSILDAIVIDNNGDVVTDLVSGTVVYETNTP